MPGILGGEQHNEFAIAFTHGFPQKPAALPLGANAIAAGQGGGLRRIG
ncbi:MAG: hypothetical protein PHI93_03035 [Kiritimatiellae bacterium]|nr:hypothetical protein [Kiritimatiellia bacterium]